MRLIVEEETSTFLVEDIKPFEDLSFFAEGNLKLYLPHNKVHEEALIRIRELIKNIENAENSLPLRIVLVYPDCLVYFEPNGYKFPLNLSFIDLFLSSNPGLNLRFELA